MHYTYGKKYYNEMSYHLVRFFQNLIPFEKILRQKFSAAKAIIKNNFSKNFPMKNASTKPQAIFVNAATNNAYFLTCKINITIWNLKLWQLQ
jgi:hypothetical protein